jgi:transglutaminase/protease-like cytokinesis protein 3
MIKWILFIITFLSQSKIEAQISDFKNINFKNADKIAYAYKGNDLSNLPELAHNLTFTLSSDVEKFRAIYTWVSTNIEGDYDGFRKNSAKRNKHQYDTLEQHKWNKLFRNQVFKKLLKEKKTICTGYAYLVKNLANLANINCEIIDGFGRNVSTETSKLKIPNHSWNAVQLNNKWYLCDATWSSGVCNLNTYTFDFNYNDGYFLADSELFAKDHFPNDDSWFLKTEKQQFSEFLKAPIVYGTSYKYLIFPVEPSVMHLEIEKNNEAVFILKDLKGIDSSTIYLQIDYGTSSEIIKPTIERIKDNVVKIKHSFTNVGSYDVHINFGIQPICTYVVKVKKQS